VAGDRFAWYSDANRNRLWRGLRSGERMTCHPTDCRHPQINGKRAPETVQTRECAGALILVQREVMKAQATPEHLFRRYRREHPHGLTISGIAAIVERFIFGGVFGSRMGRPNLDDKDIQHAPLGVWESLSPNADKLPRRKKKP
jgi:hypothetical protein